MRIRIVNIAVLAGYRLLASGHQDRISHQFRADPAFGSLHDPNYACQCRYIPGRTIPSLFMRN